MFHQILLETIENTATYLDPIGLFPFTSDAADSLNPSNSFTNNGSIGFTTTDGFACAGPINANQVFSKPALFYEYVNGIQKWALSVDVYITAYNAAGGYVGFILNGQVQLPSEQYQSLTIKGIGGPSGEGTHGYQNNGVGGLIAGRTVPLDEWVNVTAMAGTGGIKLYINRELVASNLTKTGYYDISTGVSTLFDIGNHSVFLGCGFNIIGYIKRLRFYDGTDNIADIEP